MFQHINSVGGGDGDGAARAAFADHGGDERRLHVEACLDGTGDGFGLAALFRRHAGKGAGGIDEAQHRQTKLARQVEQPDGLAIALGRGHAEIVLQARLRVVAALLPQKGDGAAPEARKTRQNGFVLAIRTVAR